MKKAIIIVSMLALAALATAQDTITLKKHSLGMGFSSLINNTMRISYERMFKNNHSLVLSAGFTILRDLKYDIEGGSAEVQYRFNNRSKYYQYDVFFYYAPFFGYQQIDYKNHNANAVDNDWQIDVQVSTNDEEYVAVENTTKDKVFSNIQAGCLFGVRTIPASNIFIDANIGGGMRYSFDYDGKNFADLGTQQLGYSGIYPRLSITVGVVF